MNVVVRKISLMVRMGSNPYGSRPNFFGQQKFAFDEGGKFSAGRNGWCAFEKVVGIERLGGCKAILPSWRHKSLVNKKADVSQLKRNKTTVCALPSSHLPLTREARTWCWARGGCDFATVVVMAVLGATGGASSSPTKSERDSAENLIDGADGEQSPP